MAAIWDIFLILGKASGLLARLYVCQWFHLQSVKQKDAQSAVVVSGGSAESRNKK
jgi:hypothetical protein